jgi:GAF domain-containing protein
LDKTRQEKEGFGSVDTLNQAAAHVTFLSEAGKILATSIHPQATFKHLIDTIIPALADACIISLVNSEEEVERLGFGHINREKQRLLKEVDLRFPFNPNENRGAAFVIRTKKLELVSDLKEKDLKTELGRIMFHEIGVRSYITVPLILDTNEIVGAIWIGTTVDSDRRLNSIDLELAKDLAVLAAHAVHNSTLYQKAVTETEQYRIRQQIREDFVAKQIHDIKTPLSALSLQLQLFMVQEKPEQDITEKIHKAVDNLARAFAMLDNMKFIYSASEQGTSN